MPHNTAYCRAGFGGVLSVDSRIAVQSFGQERSQKSAPTICPNRYGLFKKKLPQILNKN